MFGLEDLRRGVAAFAADFRADLLDGDGAAAAAADAAAIEKMAAAVKAMAVARVAETEAWQQMGDASAAHYLARISGGGVGQAREALAAAERLAALPVASAAARAGALSPQQVAAVADAATMAPSAERRLVEHAGRVSLGELRQECARTKAAADPDADSRRRRIHAGRFARRRTTADGAGEIWFRSTPEEMAEVWSVLQGYAAEAYKQARAEGRRESSEAYAADGMLAMARSAARSAGLAADDHPEAAADPPPPQTSAPVPTKIVVRIDWEALLRGFPIEGEVSEIAGIGPVPVGVVRTMMASGDPFLAAVVTKGVDVVNVAHLGRRATRVQQTGLDWLSPTCSREGCNRTDGLEIDHAVEWNQSRVTLLRFLDRLCAHDHDLKTYQGWSLVAGVGRRAMVPPDDPRHPSHPANAPPRSAA